MNYSAEGKLIHKGAQVPRAIANDSLKSDEWLYRNVYLVHLFDIKRKMA